MRDKNASATTHEIVAEPRGYVYCRKNEREPVHLASEKLMEPTPAAERARSGTPAPESPARRPRHQRAPA
jgi:hypothetical protein